MRGRTADAVRQGFSLKILSRDGSAVERSFDFAEFVCDIFLLARLFVSEDILDCNSMN